MAPFVGAMLVSCSYSHQAVLDAAPYLLTENLENGLCTSLSYQITQGLNIPPKRSQTKIGPNAPQNQNKKHPLSLPTHGSISPFHTTIGFLHACTPARPHARTSYACTPAHSDSVQGTNRRSATRHKKTYPSKNVGGAQTVGNDSSGGASEPHRRIDREGAWHSATIRCHAIYRVWCWCFCVCLCYSSLRGGSSWKSMW
jgi:hypothetical protein